MRLKGGARFRVLELTNLAISIESVMRLKVTYHSCAADLLFH